MKTLQQAILEAKQNGGSTLWFTTEHSDGYVVGNGKVGVQFVKELPPTAYLNYLKGKWQAAGYDGMGFWLDGGIWYIDPVRHYQSVNVALFVANCTEELAIYDIAKERAISVT